MLYAGSKLLRRAYETYIIPLPLFTNTDCVGIKEGRTNRSGFISKVIKNKYVVKIYELEYSEYSKYHSYYVIKETKTYEIYEGNRFFTRIGCPSGPVMEYL